MKIEQLARKTSLTQPTYEPGKPIETVARELGLDPKGIIKLASNENPFGASPKGLEAARQMLAEAHLYPDGGCYALRNKLARRHGLGEDQIVVGNGSNDILELLGHALLGPGDEVVMGNPAFIVYKLVTLLFGATPVEVPLVGHRHDLNRLREAVTERTRIVFLPSPNNPTGTANSEADILAFARSLPEQTLFAFDEAYAEYLDAPPDLTPLIREGRKVICLRTFSKIFGLASLRVGYGYGPSALAALLNRVRQPFNVNAMGQAAALAALDDTAFVQDCVRRNREGLAQLAEGFDRLGLESVPSVANFLLVRVGDGQAAFQALQRAGIIVRPMAGYGLPEYVRVTVGTGEQNARLLTEMRHLAHPVPTRT